MPTVKLVGIEAISFSTMFANPGKLNPVRRDGEKDLIPPLAHHRGMADYARTRLGHSSKRCEILVYIDAFTPMVCAFYSQKCFPPGGVYFHI